MKNTFRILLGILLLSGLPSCFHKDVMEDHADDVKQVVVCRTNGKDYIVTLESVFQATSKSSGGGVTHISGYNEFRITTYNPETGNVVARVELGEGMEDNECYLIGFFGDKLWMFGMREDFGLHCRDITTLLVSKNQEQLKAEGDLKTIQLARPTWSQINDFYGWVPGTNDIIVTDQQGFHYRYNTASHKATRTEETPPESLAEEHALSNQGKYDVDKYISSNGDKRKHLVFGWAKKENNLTYIDPSYIIDRDDTRAALYDSAYYNGMRLQGANVQRSMDSLRAAHNWLANNAGSPWNAPGYDSKVYNMYNDLVRELENIGRELKTKRSMNDHVLEDRILQPTGEPRMFFVWHAADISDTCHAIISKIEMNVADSTFRETWSSHQYGICYNPSRADQMSSFETVFSDGNPDFDFQWFDCIGNQLIYISQLSMVAIDRNTGKQLWKKQL